MNVLVVGGAGYIGSHAVSLLKNQGHNVIIYDDFSKGHKEVGQILNVKIVEGDLADKAKIKDIFISEKIDVVMHFAAFIEVGESVIDPAKYYENNVAKVLKLLDAMVESNVLKFIFSSTAATFGEPIMEKINEEEEEIEKEEENES